ncbi:HNH endonuclease signature motif containing protein [Arthrobacter sp. G.S.26]|uniref:HNH endonuclease signature motif containing protein n=1 Tax=Arthrobacter sp. G.S.26 TaxID=3433706 RepID=UPI003D78479B
MGNSTRQAAAMEAVHASISVLAELFSSDPGTSGLALEASAAGSWAADGVSAGDLNAAGLSADHPDASKNSAADAGTDLLQRAYDVRLDRLAEVSRLEAMLAAIKARDAAECAELQLAMTPPDASAQTRTFRGMSVVEEVAGVLTVSAAAAGALIASARQLCTLPLAMTELASGRMSWQHARIIADATDGLDAEAAAELTSHFLDPDDTDPARGCPAGELVPGRFRQKVRRWRERHHPESLETRHAKGFADRRIEFSPDRDGMAWVSGFLPATAASAICNRTTSLARGTQGPNEQRTLTQLKADIFAAALLGNGASRASQAGDFEESAGGFREQEVRGAVNDVQGLPGDHVNDVVPDGTAGFRDLSEVPVPAAQVLVTVPVFSLLGVGDEPAMLDGYGPIPASMARKLVAEGASSFYRVLIDPRNGAPLEIGRKSYRLTEAMKRWLRLRDGKCPFPGCSNPSLDNEADHLLSWHSGGTTGISNLGQPCRKHHRLKHNSAWRPTAATKDEPPGWISPSGRQYKSEQQDWEPPEWPPGLLPGDRSPFEEALVLHLSG